MTRPHPRGPARLLATLLVLGVSLGAVACGGDGDGGGSGSGSSRASGNGTDAAFVDEMVAHHKAAVEMANTAQQRSRSAFVRNLADDIVETQTSEISLMRGIKADLAGVKKVDLGMSTHDMGMSADTASLHDARPFDRSFVDMMVPHHQGAIRMARIQLEKGQNAELQALAKEIITAQSREIRQLNEFRNERYGSPSPAGGVPMADDQPSGMDMDEHGG